MRPLLRHALRVIGLGLLLGLILYAAYLAWGMRP